MCKDVSNYSDSYVGGAEVSLNDVLVSIPTNVCLSCVRAKCKGCRFAEDREEQDADFS